MNHKLTLAFVLAAPLMAQAPFSQPWNIKDTGAWSKQDSILPGAMVAVFSNIYCDQMNLKWYWRILIPMALSLGYETYRWASGKQPLALNGLWAGVGAAGTTVIWKVRF